MAKALIIGAGGVSNVVAHKCCQASEVFSEICIASRNMNKCEHIKNQIPDTSTQISVAQVNADDPSHVIDLITRFQPNVVINVALPYQDLPIMDACLETGVDYLDTANYEPRDTPKFEYKWQWVYHEKFKQKGIMALLGCGFDPGVTNVFCAYANKYEFDEIHTIDIIDANAGDHGYHFATNFNTEINLREITAKGRYFDNGIWHEVDALSVHKPFDFPVIGPREIYLIYHEELESLAKHLKGIKTLRFWMTFSEKYLTHLKVLENVGMTSIVPVDFQGQKIVPLHFLQALLPDPASLGARTKGKTCIGCVIQGIQNGKPKQYYIYNICDHEACYAEVKSQAISYTTGVPAMIGAMLMLQGVWKRPGVFNVEELEPKVFMDKLNIYGLPWQSMIL
ncbi:MAG: saccharopine dehydrogenase family protein [Desulfobacterales bacterium]|nr:saccharopine dehydrogenase family protein [Desulfobacterales bacterium]